MDTKGLGDLNDDVEPRRGLRHLRPIDQISIDSRPFDQGLLGQAATLPRRSQPCCPASPNRDQIANTLYSQRPDRCRDPAAPDANQRLAKECRSRWF